MRREQFSDRAMPILRMLICSEGVTSTWLQLDLLPGDYRPILELDKNYSPRLPGEVWGKI